MLANMAANLFLHKQIRTTHPKALEARRLAESLITKAKKGDLHARRLVLKVIRQKDVVKITFCMRLLLSMPTVMVGIPGS